MFATKLFEMGTLPKANTRLSGPGKPFRANPSASVTQIAKNAKVGRACAKSTKARYRGADHCAADSTRQGDPSTGKARSGLRAARKKYGQCPQLPHLQRTSAHVGLTFLATRLWQCFAPL